jgi:hypothetical protein
MLVELQIPRNPLEAMPGIMLLFLVPNKEISWLTVMNLLIIIS